MMGSMQMDKERERAASAAATPAAATTTWCFRPNPMPSPQAPLPPQQSVGAQQLPLLSPREEVGGDEHEEVMLSKNMVVEIGGVMACDREKRMMASIQMDNEKELLQQQPQHQQPQLPGAAAPDPWPPSIAAEDERQESDLGARRRLHWLVLQHLQRLRARDAYLAPYSSAANTSKGRSYRRAFFVLIIFLILLIFLIFHICLKIRRGSVII